MKRVSKQNWEMEAAYIKPEMTLRATLDRAIQIFRQQPMVFFGLAAIPGLVQMAASLAGAHQGATGALRAGATLAMFVFAIVHLIVQTMSIAAICLATSTVYLGGSSTIRDAFNAFRSRKGRLVVLTFLQGLFAGWPFIIAVVIGPVIGAAVGLAVRSHSAALYVRWSIWIIALIPCLALYARYALAFPATATEDLPASQAIDRSVALSEGGRMRICLGVVVPAAPSFAITFGSIGLISHFKAYSPLLAGSPLGVAFIDAIAALLATLVFSPYSAIVLTLLYYDQRIRREGFDVERMMVAAGLNPNAVETAVGLPAPAVPPLAHGVLTALAESPEGNHQA
jgi:MFS family permease